MSKILPAGAVRTVLPLLLVLVLSATPPVARAAVFCANNATELRNVLALVGSNGESDEVRIRNVRMPTSWAMGPLSTYAAVLSDGKNLVISGGWRDNLCNAQDPDASRTVLLPAPGRGILRIDTPDDPAQPRPVVTITNLTLTGADEMGGHGCALNLHGRHHARMVRTRVIDNQCDSAVVLSVRGGDIDLLGNLIAWNSTIASVVRSYQDAGAHVGKAVIAGNTLTGNQAGTPWVVHFPGNAATVKWIENNVVWGNALAGGSPGNREIELSGAIQARVRHNLSAEGHGLLGTGQGNLAAHAGFVDPGYPLPGAASPLRNAGLSSPHSGLPPYDLAGVPRVVEGQVDIGAYEFESIFSHGME
ncbi:MAG: hypothetical protein KF823_01475 [Xanthomonadales bacterium]|nr:hypothetical protein [Xanthomonadales bacterium]